MLGYQFFKDSRSHVDTDLCFVLILKSGTNYAVKKFVIIVEIRTLFNRI